MLILLLAANTAFADFPRLCFFLARDRFIPRQFGTQGDRLVFSNGIIILSGVAVVLLIVFGGDTHALIPLYAVGVFLSFTLSQSGMVRRWLTRKEEGWQWRVWLNGIGALVTGIVMLTIAVTKFALGAWIVVVLLPTLVGVFLLIHRHYEEVARQLSTEAMEAPPPLTNTVLVLVGDLHRGVVRALQYAQSLSPNAKAVFIEVDPERTRRLEEKWGKWGMGVPLIVLASPYRSLLGPLREYIDHLQGHDENHMITIILPEFVPRVWWHHLLHNQTALLVKGAMLFPEERDRGRRALPSEALIDVGGSERRSPRHPPPLFWRRRGERSLLPRLVDGSSAAFGGASSAGHAASGDISPAGLRLRRLAPRA